MRVGNMIIARCWSGRFPGKVIAPLYGKPVIEWIVEKAKALGLVGETVIAASDHKADDALEHIAIRCGIKCTRGPADDLLARMEIAADACGLTHWVQWSGDSPFADVRIANAIVQCIREKPEALMYSAGPYPSGTTGIHVQGATRWWLHQGRGRMSDPRVQSMLLDGWDWWHMSAVIPDCFEGEAAVADITPLFRQCDSLFSMCIDYPLQLDFFETICQWVGHFPTFEDIERAHREMRRGRYGCSMRSTCPLVTPPSRSATTRGTPGLTAEA